MTLLYFTLTTHTHIHSQAHTGHSNPNLKRSLQHISFLTLPHALLIPCITPHTSHSLHYPTHISFLTLPPALLIPCITPHTSHSLHYPTHITFLALPHTHHIPCITPYTSHSLHYPTHISFLALPHTHHIPCITPHTSHSLHYTTHISFLALPLVYFTPQIAPHIFLFKQQNALLSLGNPLQTLKRMYELIDLLCAQLDVLCRRHEESNGPVKSVATVRSFAYSCPVLFFSI